MIERTAMTMHPMKASITDNTLLLQRYNYVRDFSSQLAEPLSPEDCQIQSMNDTSPTKWHLAHTTWFFETFILVEYMKNYQRQNDEFHYLYNSYYNGAGQQFPRPKRGMVTRPSLAEIMDYRGYVDRHIAQLLADEPHPEFSKIAFLIEIGTHHEQQHQELILTDIKHGFSVNTKNAIYCDRKPEIAVQASPLQWVDFSEGLYEIGHDSMMGYAFDSEGPNHQCWLNGFQLASRPVTNGEYLAFMTDKGYDNSDLWLSEGWYFLAKNKREHPAYWQKRDDGWYQFTLSGWLPLNLEEPVCHVNFYEAQAYAMWAGGRLPTEAEWEVAATPFANKDVPALGRFHPNVAQDNDKSTASPLLQMPLLQMIGEVWEWTLSSYAPYPGFEPLEGVVGEYNGKFMCNQYVLRGGSCVTPAEHMRITYRNFFPTHIDWQFTGIRLARNS